eukprot:6101773-Amphidinium_carterae.3
MLAVSGHGLGWTHDITRTRTIFWCGWLLVVFGHFAVQRVQGLATQGVSRLSWNKKFAAAVERSAAVTASKFIPTVLWLALAVDSLREASRIVC